MYKNAHNLNVDRYFENVDEIILFQDKDTGYSFFYPEIKTDSIFYEHFQQFDWYYMDLKWEHEFALQIIPANSRILEIGCGNGMFLKRLTGEGHETFGLEINKASAKILNENGLKVFCKNIQSFSEEYKNSFDIVACFQVLEHIYDINTFLNSAVKLLKKGGSLIISVPNNDSFIKYAYPFALNIPPHHLGMWNVRSLKSLARIFSLETEKIVCEPLQEYHFEWYFGLIKNRFVKRYGFVAKLIFFPFRNKKFIPILRSINKHIKGLTILGVYKKI